LLDLAESLQTEALCAFQNELQINPQDSRAATQATYLLMNQKLYVEAIDVLQKPIDAAPENYDLQRLRANVLLRGGNTAEGIAEAERISKATSQASHLTNLAYYLAEANAGLIRYPARHDGSQVSWLWA
jgi:predicted Zn-dependent protease